MVVDIDTIIKVVVALLIFVLEVLLYMPVLSLQVAVVLMVVLIIVVGMQVVYLVLGNFGCGSYGYGGSQTASYSSLSAINSQGTTNSSSNCAAGFGFGGFGCYYASGYGGAGGGGWYGGQGTYPDGSGDDDGGGGGGSGYVYTSSSASNYPQGCLLNSSYYLSDASNLSGNESFKSPSGATETGHSDNGYCRITCYVKRKLYIVK